MWARLTPLELRKVPGLWRQGFVSLPWNVQKSQDYEELGTFQGYGIIRSPRSPGTLVCSRGFGRIALPGVWGLWYVPRVWNRTGRGENFPLLRRTAKDRSTHLETKSCISFHRDPPERMSSSSSPNLSVAIPALLYQTEAPLAGNAAAAAASPSKSAFFVTSQGWNTICPAGCLAMRS